MLSMHHNERTYPAPVFQAKARGVERVSRMPGSVVVDHRLADELPTWDDGDLNEMTLDEFSNRYLSVRDELALRRLRGEQLTAREAALLDQLNHALSALLPRPAPLSADVLEAMDEVRRLAAGR